MQQIVSTPLSSIIINASFHKTLSLLLSLFISFDAYTQEHIYKNFGVDDGLPSSEVYNIYQDKEGYIWFATDKGLSRYNGYEFENFNTSDGLTGNVVLRFYPQKNGQIWCYSFHNQSLFYFNEVFDGFKQYEYNDILNNTLKPNSVVKSVCLDEANNLHIGGVHINGEILIQNDGVYRILNSSENYYSDTISFKKIVLNPLVDSIGSIFYYTTLDLDQKNNNLFYVEFNVTRLLVKWLLNNEIAVFMNDKKVELLFKNQEKKIIQNNFSPAGIDVLNDEQLFIGYVFGGGKIFDRNGTLQKEILEGHSVSSCFVDHEGGLWFSTLDSGVFYIKNLSVAIYNSNNLKSHHVKSLVKTKDNDLLIGYENGTISKLSSDRLKFEIEQPKNTMPAFVEYDSTNNKTYTFSNAELKDNQGDSSILAQYILKLSEPKDNVIYASFANGYFEIKEDHSILRHSFPYRVYDVCVWNNDTIIATPIGLFSKKNSEIISLADKSKLFEFRCEDVDVNSQKTKLFVATQGAGVIICHEDSIYNITEKEGLNSNVVNEVYLENDSTVWACTNRGINRIIWGENGFMVSGMSKKDGLLSNEVQDIEIINDTVWVGTKQGLCYFPKKQLDSKTIDFPYLKLKDVIVDKISRNTMTALSLTHKENDIDFVLEGISYSNEGKVYYQFRLNENNNWSSTQNRVIQFSSLSPGDYVFEAKMCIDDQGCSEKTIKYTFTIHAPFWKTGWFALLCTLGLGMLIYLFFKIRVFTYNKDITRELIRLLVKRLKKDEMYFSFRENGNEIRIKTHEILFVKSAGNYLDVHSENKTYTVRMNIGKFLDHVPDKLEYVRLHRSYIVRIDKITLKSRNEVQLLNNIKIPVSLNKSKRLKEVVF